VRYDPERHQRRSIRLRGYDYARAGGYFVTVCTHQRACLFGAISDGQMRLNAVGQVATQCWRAIPDHFPDVRCDEFVVMPNHIHGILWIVTPNPSGVVVVVVVGANHYSPLRPPQCPPQPGPSNQAPPRGTSKTIGSVVRGFKIGVTLWMRGNDFDGPVWQRGYYEHIIRKEESLNRIRQYILDNPARWATANNNLTVGDIRTALPWLV
jgi:REP element-mobilizing transposase RayT